MYAKNVPFYEFAETEFKFVTPHRRAAKGRPYDYIVHLWENAGDRKFSERNGTQAVML